MNEGVGLDGMMFFFSNLLDSKCVAPENIHMPYGRLEILKREGVY